MKAALAFHIPAAMSLVNIPLPFLVPSLLYHTFDVSEQFLDTLFPFIKQFNIYLSRLVFLYKILAELA